MDVEFGENMSCVILSLMGVCDRPRKKLIREHKRVLSDEYHQKVASMDYHVRRSSFKCYSFGTSRNCETSVASAAIGRNKRCKLSTNEEEMNDVASYERKASGEIGLVDELISGICSSHETARQHPQLVNLSEPSTKLRIRFSCKRSLGSYHKDNRYEDCLRDLFSASSFASSVVSCAREIVRGENAASDSTTKSDVAVGKVHAEAKMLHGNPNMTGVPTSCAIQRNYDPSPADTTEQVYEIEQETSLSDSEDSYCMNQSSIETDSFMSFEEKYLHSPDSVLESYAEEMPSDIIYKTSGHGTQLHSVRFPSMSCSGEIGTTIMSNEGREDPCGDGSTIQDNSRPSGIRENREFGYIMEILTEAGFCLRSLDKWHSLDSPLSPFVFEMVEKRYEDDKTWETSDRVLLFDRMNSLLEGNLRRLMPMPVPSGHVFRRISDRFRLDDIDEEALWSALVKEGKALKRETIEDLLKNDFGSLDLAEFIEFIVSEIERSAIDTLISEIVDTSKVVERAAL